MAHPLARLAVRFPRKRCFITGAGNGLGLEIARALANDGWSLGIFDRNVERLAAVEADLSEAGVKVLAYPGDVTQTDELTVAINSFAAANDGLDLMVNNAGVAASGNIMESSLDDWRWILDINVMGVVNGCRAAVPHLQRNGTGLLINISSAAAFGSIPGMASYSASKAAVVSISETLAAELRRNRIQVSVVMPTFFKTGLLDTFRGPEHARALAQRMMEQANYPAAHVARDLLRSAASGNTYVVLPQSARLLWRLKRLMPETFITRLARRFEGARKSN